jgi:N-acetylneuraminate epimerase
MAMISLGAKAADKVERNEVFGRRTCSPAPLAVAFLPLVCLLLLAAETLAAAPRLPLQWSQLRVLPDKLGLAGSFAGVSGGALLVAGGANFPHQMPWQGGKKAYYDTVWALAAPNGRWANAGKLPRPLGYGVSVSHQNTVICVGGSDATQHYAETLRLRWSGTALAIDSLPALPIPLANMSGALAGHVLYVAGGTSIPGEQSASSRFFALDLEAQPSAWRELEPVPGPPRLLAVPAAQNDAFHLFGGVALAPNAEGTVGRVFLREALSYRPGRGWKRLADLPRPSVAAPSPAPFVAGKLLLLAGDDGSRAGFKPPDMHPGFASTILAYDPAADVWSEAGEVPAPRATACCVEWDRSFVVPSGEMRPGIRSPEIWAFRVRGQEAGE